LEADYHYINLAEKASIRAGLRAHFTQQQKFPPMTDGSLSLFESGPSILEYLARQTPRVSNDPQRYSILQWL
jgi:glutathione S-transferase